MYGIEMVVALLAVASDVPYGSIILLALIPFIVVALVVGTVFVLQWRRKRRMRDM